MNNHQVCSHSTRTCFLVVENDNMDSDTEAESEMSLKIQIILAQGE